jgi:hypothetical protein
MFRIVCSVQAVRIKCWSLGMSELCGGRQLKMNRLGSRERVQGVSGEDSERMVLQMAV